MVEKLAAITRLFINIYVVGRFLWDFGLVWCTTCVSLSRQWRHFLVVCETHNIIFIEIYDRFLLFSVFHDFIMYYYVSPYLCTTAHVSIWVYRCTCFCGNVSLRARICSRASMCTFVGCHRFSNKTLSWVVDEAGQASISPRPGLFVSLAIHNAARKTEQMIIHTEWIWLILTIHVIWIIY